MLKALLFPLTISLLVRLGTAAPVFHSPSLIPGLDCHPFFGQGIQASDCAWALEKLGRMPTTSIDPATGRTVTFSGVFSRGMSNPVFRMPQRFVVGTCAIIVDMSNPYASVTSTWAFAGLGGHELVTSCALASGLGGITNRLGFDTVLVNPFNMNEQTLGLWDRCSGLIDGFGQTTKPTEAIQCVPPDAAAAMRAGLVRSESTGSFDVKDRTETA